MIDLTKLPDFYIGKHGLARIAEVTGKSASLCSMWSRRGKFPLDAVSRLLEFDPTPLAAIQPLYGVPPPGTNKLAILVPLAGKPEPKMMDCLLRLYDKHEMGYQRVAFNCLSVSRNALAAWFLRGPYEWAFWMDGDSVLPCGDAQWFKEAMELPTMPDAFAGVHSIYRMLVHKKTIVSCAYVGRREGAPPQFGGPADVNRNLMRRGPQSKLIEVPWAGFGGILTHRSVFEDIVKTQGDEIRMSPNSEVAKRFGYDFAFFHPSGPETPGDDIPFLDRAAKAGHATHVDLAVQAGHIGDRCFTFADI